MDILLLNELKILLPNNDKLEQNYDEEYMDELRK